MSFTRVTVGKQGQVAYTEETLWGTVVESDETIRIGNQEYPLSTKAHARTALSHAMRSGTNFPTQRDVVRRIHELHPDLVADKRYDRYKDNENPLDKVLRIMGVKE